MQQDKLEKYIKKIRSFLQLRYLNKFIDNKISYEACKYLMNTCTDIYSMLPPNFELHLFYINELNLSEVGCGLFTNNTLLNRTLMEKTLVIVDLSNNSLTEFPIQILKLQMLILLNLSENKIPYLPHDIKNLTRLKCLDLSNNNLSYLPASVCKIKLDYVDISNNSFLNETNCYVCNMPPSLTELSTRTVVNTRLADAVKLPNILINSFDKETYCTNCEKRYFNSYIRQVTDHIPDTELALYVTKSLEKLLYECYYCSFACKFTFNDKFNVKVA